MAFQQGMAKVPTSLFKTKRSKTRGKNALKKNKTFSRKKLASNYHAENVKKRSRKKDHG